MGSPSGDLAGTTSPTRCVWRMDRGTIPLNLMTFSSPFHPLSIIPFPSSPIHAHRMLFLLLFVGAMQLWVCPPDDVWLLGDTRECLEEAWFLLPSFSAHASGLQRATPSMTAP